VQSHTDGLSLIIYDFTSIVLSGVCGFSYYIHLHVDFVHVICMQYRPGLTLGVCLSVLAEMNTETVDAVAVNHAASIHTHAHVSMHTHTHTRVRHTAVDAGATSHAAYTHTHAYTHTYTHTHTAVDAVAVNHATSIFDLEMLSLTRRGPRKRQQDKVTEYTDGCSRGRCMPAC
jgi:hypothetical protein